MSNFYGGRDGKAFIISASYESIVDMVNDFRTPQRTSQGVNFNDYVLIQTKNKNNPENGRIYRRGLDYDNKTNKIINYYNPSNTSISYKLNDTMAAHGAEYVGHIVGPAGKPPALRITKYTDAELYQSVLELSIDTQGKKFEDYLNTTSSTKNGIVEVDGVKSSVVKLMGQNYFCYYDKYDTQAWRRFTVAPTVSGGSNDMTEMIPAATISVNAAGQASVSNQHNSIEWSYFSYRDMNEEETLALLGFRFVTPINYFTSESVSPYYKDSIVTTDPNEHKDNPFLDHWHLRIPKGIKGNALMNFRIEEVSAGQTGIEEFLNNKLQPKSFAVKEKAFLCDYYSYDENIAGTNYTSLEQGTKHIIYLGEYEQIAEITLEADGNLTFIGTSNYTFSKVLTWVNKCQYNDATGVFTFGLNNADNGVTHKDFSVNLKTVNDLEVRDQQLYAIFNTTENNEKSLGTFLISGPENDPRATENLMNGGIWLVTEEV